MTEIGKILVANRGEIAVRIMRSLKELGIKTVAVYSEIDRNSLHVRYADEAVCIGPSPSSQSYLQGEKIIGVCKDLKVDAVHPGYGFLSENAQFAQQVIDAGLIFIGPSPSAIKTMGSKLAAKEAALKYHIPMVPGGNHAIEDLSQGKEIASSVGYPVLIKASAGGGGKGMRIVYKEEEFKEQMERAVSEATSAFGNGSVFIEKYISSPKHIEIQVIGDHFGNIVHLFERDCSIQRRYQKIIEEAPSSVLNEEVRRKMGEAAIKVAQSCQYYSAGTVEFIMDEEYNFYFLEMNTRLQVEHPVTELITGIDLVKEQVKIAQGQKLSFTQEDVSIRGHAIELRVYAENPANNFLPDIGKLNKYKLPQGPGVRVDNGFEEGMEIPVFYDPMIAKLVVYGQDRTEAIQRMVRAIDEYEITGIENTLSFGKFVMQHEVFKNSTFDTHFVNKFFTPEKLTVSESNEVEEELAAMIVTLLLTEQKDTSPLLENMVNNKSNWKRNRLKD